MSFNLGDQGYHPFDPESGEMNRKRSLVKPERNRMSEDHPQFHYTQTAQQQALHLKIMPSTTGLDPQMSAQGGEEFGNRGSFADEDIPLMDIGSRNASPERNDNLRGGREVFGLNDEVEKSPSKKKNLNKNPAQNVGKKKSSNIYFWKVYCYVITFWAPAPLLRLCGLPTKLRQFAWREKIGLLTCILYVGTFVAYLTFGFTKTVCSSSQVRVRNNEVNDGNIIINGRFYDLTHSQHPAAAGISKGANILYPPINAGGRDASFLFQNVNGNCKGLIKPKEHCNIPVNDNDELAWYMPCRMFNQDGSSKPNNTAAFYKGWACHTSSDARKAYYNMGVTGDVYFTWDDIRNTSRNLMVYSGNVLDLNLIEWIQSDQVTYPELFDKLKDDHTYRGFDISMVLTNPDERRAARCLTEIIKVGTIDSDTIGCLASTVVLYSSLVFILSVVLSKFFMACYFRWAIAPKQGATNIDNKSMIEREREIENWVDGSAALGDIKEVPERARANYKRNRANRQSVFVKSSNRLSLGANEWQQYYDDSNKLSKTFKYTTMTTQAAMLERRKKKPETKNNRQSTLYLNEYNSSTELLTRPSSMFNPFDTFDDFALTGLSADIIHPDVVPQPPVEYQPFGFPLAHSLTLVTCYSEDAEGLRVTLDSVATTDYPNSHKTIFIVCDGLIKGSGNDLSTPEIALSMMSDFTIAPEDVQPYSYVAVAQGSKRHNMAKVYAGFYKYDDETVPVEKQQRVPVITVVKCGTPAEAGSAKPGNRGKRDSQIILMSFLQKVMFDERMTELEFELLNQIWRVTGLMAEFYEIVLMVDADTKVYPDSLTHMTAEMVKDPLIMGLCGETKIANKSQTWVTAIQVFEYYVSHHQAKGFESVFGGVTCLPGCFSMYRIKSPKGSDGYWVPILANPDIVERYSDNVTDTLHKKNLLLLGEDRYLTSLMLKTFPKRKQVFVPKAACVTMVPDKFKVLLSQRRRWINSTVHNLMELVLVNDLCGTFCFSMQFCIGIELIGTLVLPAAITFTLYVIIIAIVSKPTPIMTLILLAVIFGLPGTLIAVTVSSFSYVIYFFIYLLALPIWNFVLPSYAYWKFDDFSWGETRAVDGDKGDHSNAEGEFDYTHIVMKRWKEFERDRRQKENGIQAPGAAWDPSNIEKNGSEAYSDGSSTP